MPINAQSLEVALEKHQRLTQINKLLQAYGFKNASQSALVTMNLTWPAPNRPGDEEDADGLRLRMSLLREVLETEVKKLQDELEALGVKL